MVLLIMQTFLPYPDFQKSAQVLDYRRLGKQRVEAMQILQTLEGKSQGWRNHPAVKMWRGHEDALKAYMTAMINEWVKRGYRNTIPIPNIATYSVPSWIGNEAFHASHRSNLKRKDGEYYKQFTEPNDLPYVWPTD